MNPKKVMKIGVAVLVVLMVLVFLLKVYVVVEPGERAVIFNKLTGGLRVTPSEGFYFLLPFVESVVIYDVKVKTYTMSAISFEGELKGDDALQALTSDGQTVLLDISIRFHPLTEKLIYLHKEIGSDYVNKVVRPQVRAIARLTVSEYNVIDVYSAQRQMIQQKITDKLRALFAQNYLILDEVLLRNVKFSPEFQKAIENKQIAQQEAQRMKYILEQQEMEKKRKIIEAEGDAEAIRLRGKALAENPKLIQYEYVQKLSPNVQAVITDQSTIINLSDFLKEGKKDK